MIHAQMKRHHIEEKIFKIVVNFCTSGNGQRLFIKHENFQENRQTRKKISSNAMCCHFKK